MKRNSIQVSKGNKGTLKKIFLIKQNAEKRKNKQIKCMYGK